MRVARVAKLRKPGHGEQMGVGWRFVWLVLYWPVSFLVKVRYIGMERIPQGGPAIIVVNHVSHIDPFLVAKYVLDAARVPRFLAKDSLFEVPAVGWGMRIMGHIPVKRGTTDARQSLAAAVAALERGEILVLHPEGTVTRDPDGWPMVGKTGAARLVTLVPDVPVIPIAQWGVQESIDLYTKKVKLYPRPKHVLAVGEPIDLSAFHGRGSGARVLKEMTDVIMRRLRADVAELRELPEPDGDLFQWRRSGETPSDVA
ncbi:MAG TPA: lysophospholipid acyltransferase family protein [Jatrophihabitans sp.]|jgi:1-acyl-sn-glycerol-3-phosphate acyltransferase|uniref:lysophospholipid acyltransferase family protein n=1 Tax=Jatrophihabitans sp. TaxID=1932789 RepID=UPI002E05E41A|nr:lysophospholipid acyltransferase family protein [Jatrophihabitans sp.]